MSRHTCCTTFRKNEEKQHAPLRKIDSYLTVTASDARNKLSTEITSLLKDSAVKFVAKDVRPMNALLGTGLNELLSTFTLIGAKYGKFTPDACGEILPHPTTITRHIEKKAEQLVPTLASLIEKNFLSNGGAVTLDMWTDKYRKRSYMGITAHFIDENFALHDRVLATHFIPPDIQHTAVNLHRELMHVLRTLKLYECLERQTEKFVFVTDRGSNLVAALKNFTRLNCIEHILNNVVEEACKVHSVALLISKCKELVTYFKTSGLNLKLKKVLRGTADTRWNTVFYMIESILQNYDEARELLVQKSKTDKIDDISKVQLEILADFFEPFREMTLRLEGSSKPSICFVQPWLNAIETHLTRRSGEHSLLTDIKDFVWNYFSNLAESTIKSYHKIAMFIHPLFKSLKCFSAAERESILTEVRYFCTHT